MDFDFSDEHDDLRTAVRRWVERDFGFARRRALAKAGGATRAVYAELAALGLTAIAVPEAQGGLGLGAVEAMVVCEELGRGLVNAPFAEAALMAPLLLAASPDLALRAAWLTRIASGEALVIPALHERGIRHDLARTATAARRDDGHRWTLSGTKAAVPAGDEADAFLVPARIVDDPPLADRYRFPDDPPKPLALFLVERADAAALRAYPTQDGARAADLVLDATPAARLMVNADEALAAALDRVLAAQAAEAVGLMDEVLATTVEYLNTRRQFGVPIASFQALRHRVAGMKMALELARSMSWYATLKLDDPPAQRRRAVAQARVQSGHSMRRIGQEAIQLHGGIGCTDEARVSHCFKRLTMLELQYGDTLHHLGEVSARLDEPAGVVG